jgi:hypothetical protein
LLPHSEGEAAFDELGRFLDGLGWREQNVEVIGHDDEAVEEEAALVAVSNQRSDKEFSVGGSLEDAVALMADGSQSVGLRLQAHGRIAGEHVPGTKARSF